MVEIRLDFDGVGRVDGIDDTPDERRLKSVGAGQGLPLVRRDERDDAARSLNTASARTFVDEHGVADLGRAAVVVGTLCRARQRSSRRNRGRAWTYVRSAW